MDCMHNKITHYVDKKVLLGLWGAIIVTVNVQGTFGGGGAEPLSP